MYLQFSSTLPKHAEEPHSIERTNLFIWAGCEVYSWWSAHERQSNVEWHTKLQNCIWTNVWSFFFVSLQGYSSRPFAAEIRHTYSVPFILAERERRTMNKRTVNSTYINVNPKEHNNDDWHTWLLFLKINSKQSRFLENLSHVDKYFRLPEPFWFTWILGCF